MTSITDPWESIQTPDHAATVKGRRVDSKLPWELFWAVDTARNCLLIVHHDPKHSPSNKLPYLRGLEIEVRKPDTGAKSILVLRLKDMEQREIFHRLCIDIVAAMQLATSEEEAVGRLIARTWRWHRLLKGGRDGRLSDDEQKGFLGELTVLKKILFPNTGIKAGVKSWVGPLGSPKDFEIGRVCIEAKARRGAAKPFIAISNEYQLDTSGVDMLFLHVSEIDLAFENDHKAVTVTDAATEIRDMIVSKHPAFLELMEERFLATGFDWDDDYTDKKWHIGPRHLYQVTGQFPRIVPSGFPHGVEGVRYSIALQECEGFRVDVEDLEKLLSGGVDVP